MQAPSIPNSPETTTTPASLTVLPKPYPSQILHRSQQRPPPSFSGSKLLGPTSHQAGGWSQTPAPIGQTLRMRNQSGRRRPNATIPLAHQVCLAGKLRAPTQHFIIQRLYYHWPQTQVRRSQAVYKPDPEPMHQSPLRLRSRSMKTPEETRNK